MSRSLRYYYDFTNTTDGYRYRLVVTPHGTTTLSLTTQPAFNAGSSGVYKQLPPGVFELGKLLPSASFPGLPYGMPDSSTAKVTAYSRPLDDDGDTDLLDFWTYLLDPTHPGSPTTVGSAADGLIQSGTVYRDPGRANYFELLTDKGNGALSIGSFLPAGMWCQHRTDKPKITYNPMTGSDTLEVELNSALRVAMESILPADIARQFWSGAYLYSFNTVGAGYTLTGLTGTNPIRIEQILVDTCYTDSGRVYMRALGELEIFPGFDYRLFFMGRLQDMFSALDYLLDQVVRILARNSSMSVTFTGGTGNLRPFDVAIFRKSAYTATGEAGADTTDIWFPAGMTFSSGSVDPDHLIDGYLYQGADNDGTVFEYKTAYDFIKDATKSVAAIGATDIVNRTTLGLGTLPIYMAGACDVLPSQFKGNDSTLEPNSLIAGAASVDVKGATTEDIATVTVTLSQISEDSPESIPSVFHNFPQLGDKDDVQTFSSMFGNSCYGVITAAAGFNRLFYYDSPSGISSDPIAIRVHHKVGIVERLTFGPTVVYSRDECTDAITLPTPSFSLSEGWESYRDQFWYPLRLAYIEMQKTACLPFAVASFIAKTFSDPLQTTYSGEVPIEQAMPHDVGKIVDILTWADGSTFTTSLRHNIYPGKPILLSAEPDIAAGTSAVKLLATGTYGVTA